MMLYLNPVDTPAEYGIAGAVALPLLSMCIGIIWFLLKASRKDNLAAAAARDATTARFTDYLENKATAQTEALLAVANNLQQMGRQAETHDARNLKQHEGLMAAIDDVSKRAAADEMERESTLRQDISKLHSEVSVLNSIALSKAEEREHLVSVAAAAAAVEAIKAAAMVARGEAL